MNVATKPPMDPRLAPTVRSDAAAPTPAGSDPELTIRPLHRRDGADEEPATRIDGTLASPVAPPPTPLPPISPSHAPPPMSERRRELPQLSVDLDVTLNTGRSNPPSSPDRGPDLEVKGLLGEGGMGRVLLARQHSLDREVAVKTLRSGAGDHERESLLAEGAIVGFLEHPSIIPVHALGLDPVGRPVLVMKRIDGVEWTELLDDPRHARWPATMPNADDRLADHIEILMQVSNALHFAHQRGVVHRDVKPQNVLIGPFGDVYLADWGIAYRASRGVPPGMAGTPAFMAPEMVTGDAADERTDVYLLGATLHRILTGKSRHAGASVHETLENAARSAPFDYPEDVPADLAALANEATSRKPEKRPPTALAFRARLASHLRHRASVSIASSAADRLERLRTLIQDDLEAEGTPGERDDNRSADIDILVAETRFGLREALAQWADNPEAKSNLAALEAIAAERRRRAAEHAQRARQLDPQLSERQRRLGLVIVACAGLTLSVMGIVLGPRHVPSHVELVASGAAPLTGIIVAITVFRRQLFATVLNRVSALMLATIIGISLVGRIIAAAADVPVSGVLMMDSLVMATGLIVCATMTFRWLFVPAAMLLACGAVAGLAPTYAGFAFSLATGAGFLASFTFMSMRVGFGNPPPPSR